MNEIKIYQTEKKDGLSEVILNNKISFASSITQFKNEPEPSQIYHSIAKNNINQPDLIHRYAILASVGWNANDDVFLREELFNARSTPVDKQVNYMHDELTIIGHMTESFVLDQSGNLIKAESMEELPNAFDIGVGFVLYKLWEDKERSQLVNKVIAEIDSGNWFVSMECIFPNFDYSLIDGNGNHKVVARNEQSSFLSKHLRIYGGTGTYKDKQGEYKVGRLLRNLFFSGKGIVDNPANKRSIILGQNFSSDANNKETKMDEVEKLKAENARLTSELAEKSKAAVTKEIESAKAETLEVSKNLESTKAELEAAKAELKSANENVVKALAEAKEAKDKADEMDKECAKLKSEVAKAGRIAQLVKAGLDEAKANEIYTKWASATDEQFSDIVALHTKADDMSDDDEDDAKAKKIDLDKAEAEKAKAGIVTNTEVETSREDAIKAVSNSLYASMPFAAKAKKFFENK
jgi:hypothetical protein